jgi:hypothetical protein
MSDGVRRGYALLAFYAFEVVGEVGSDKAIQLLMQAAERQGPVLAREMKRIMPSGLAPHDAGAWVYRRFMSDAGAEVEEYRRDGESVTFRILRCPFYEAFLDTGVDCGDLLNGLCVNYTMPVLQAALKRINPALRVEPVLTRKTTEELCLERVFIRETDQGTDEKR